MPTVAATNRAKAVETIADLIDSLGGIPPWRIRCHPLPGTATEKDVLAALNAPRKRICELVDGVLVEKTMSYRESSLAGALIAFLRAFVVPGNLGIVTGEQGMMRLFPGLVRNPDVAFASWERFPGRRYPLEPIPDLAPDLVVEILSASNTESEMKRKRREYFDAGVRLVWIVDPNARSVRVFRNAKSSKTLSTEDTLTGGDVLPGFKLRLADWFAELDRRG